MNELILRLNGITPNANDFTNLSVSIGNELRIINDADTNINDIIFIDAENPEDNPLDYWMEIIDTSQTRIKRIMRKINSLIKNGLLNDSKYHTEVANLYAVIKQHDYLWLYNENPPQFTRFHNLYTNHYIKNVVKPYNKSLILEAIYVIKDNTPIVDDNICDILSFLNDEKYFKKHQVDSEIYDMI
jgi:hypothetical protein